MTIRRRIAKLAVIGAVMSVGAGYGLLATGGVAAAQTALRASQHPLAVTSATFANCQSGYYCDYVYDNGTGLCFKISPFATSGNVPNWGTHGCRNVDGSIYNNSPFTLRIYYGPNYHDPHACIKPFTKITDLFNYDFNSGSGPHNLVIGNDIASSSVNLSPCTNPL